MFNLGKSTASSTQDKKRGKIDHAEQRIKETFNIGGGGSENQDELKRKREDFAV
jgi:hypothetical protein